MVDINEILRQQEVLHIFGYGSLTWKPDFESDRQIVGFIKGYERRFWQGSTFHRGTPEQPGRVLTLTKKEQGECWGLVFEIRGRQKIAQALDKLSIREQSLGGYDVSIVPVYPKADSGFTEPIHSVIYHALPDNELYLGDAPIHRLAMDIATSSGRCGHNIEYLFRLADFMREYAPGVSDPHLFELEDQVKQIIGLKVCAPWKVLLEFPNFRELVCPTIFKEEVAVSHEQDVPVDVLVAAS